MSDAYVWIDPARRSGEPCIGGHRLPVEMVVDAVWFHGIDNAMDLWVLTRAEVIAACWYAGAGYPVRLHNNRSEYRPYKGPWRKRWGGWAAEVHQALWSVTTVDYDAIPDPPVRDEVRPAETCDHEWMEFGGPGDEWRQCFLCGKQEDAE